MKIEMTKLVSSEKFVDIFNPETKENLKFHNIWLRDHCRCELCYDSATFQRKIDLIELPQEIYFKYKRFEDQQLKIEC